MSQLTIQQAIDLALEHHRAGRLNQAEQIYRQVLAAEPRNPWALQLLGMIAHQVGNSKVAIELINRAIAIDPTPPDFHNNLGEIYRTTGKLQEAEKCLLMCLKLNPDFAAARNNLGELYRERGELERASEQYRKAIELDPNGAAPYNNLGIAKHDLGDPVTAIGLYKQAIGLNANYVDAVNNLATSYLDLRRIDEAMTTFRQAIKMDPNNSDAHSNIAYALLLNGQFAEGWEEYEWRWKCAKFPSPKRGFRQPLWNGEDIAGKRILVHAEQGLGDAIQFLRYLPMVAQRGATVILEVKPEMTRLAQQFAGIAQIVTYGEPLPEFDWQVPMLSLPRAFKTRVDSIPADVPYLHADGQLVEEWRTRLGPQSGKPRVGLAWAGNPTQGIDRFRSLKLGQLAPFARATNVAFHSVQKGYATEQLKSPPPGLQIIDHSEELTDLSQTAALMMNLDLIVSTCTSPPHLAGALGRPVWIMVPSNGDWRWMVHGDTTPWYPTMRLFRQESYANWDSTIERVAGELERWSQR